MNEPNLPRGNYFAEPGYVKTDLKTGVCRNRAGTRILCLTSDFLTGLRTALRYECDRAADLVMAKAGFHWGVKFAARLEKELGEFYGSDLNQFPLGVFEGCLAEAFSHHGWGYLSLDLSSSSTGVIGASVRNPVYAEVAHDHDAPADPMTAGVLGGIFTHFAGQELRCLQTQCQAQGHPESRFVISLPSRIEQVEPLAEKKMAHLDILRRLRESVAN